MLLKTFKCVIKRISPNSCNADLCLRCRNKDCAVITQFRETCFSIYYIAIYVCDKLASVLHTKHINGRDACDKI